VLSGGASKVDGFAHALQERFGAGVETFDPFRQISFDPDRLGVADAENVMPTAAIAVGLALRRAADR
jgi:type IV pilus assembly protein PilM